MHIQVNMHCAVVFACVCAITNHQACFQGVELAETVEVRWAFHVITRMKFGLVWLIYKQMR